MIKKTKQKVNPNLLIQIKQKVYLKILIRMIQKAYLNLLIQIKGTVGQAPGSVGQAFVNGRKKRYGNEKKGFKWGPAFTVPLTECKGKKLQYHKF